MQKKTQKNVLLFEKRCLLIFFRINFYLIILSLFTMILGPLVRAENAGLACPDWPLCNGQFIPEMNYQIFLEWLHRIVAFVLGIFFVSWIGIGLSNRMFRKSHLQIIILATFLLILQITLGALTVTELLDAYIVSSHLLNALLFLSTLVYSWRKIKENHFTKKKHPPIDYIFTFFRLKNYTILYIHLMSCIVLGMVFIQIFLGARVSTNEAGRVCNTFPACYEETIIDSSGNIQHIPEFFPKMIGNIEKHMTHRFMAYFLFGTILILLIMAIRYSWPTHLLYNIWLLFGLISTQIVVGALNVVLHIPVTITLLHSCLAFVTYLTALWFFLETRFVITN